MEKEPENVIVIDYTDLQPGDAAPDPGSPQLARLRRGASNAQPAANASVNGGGPAATSATATPGSNVIVLSADPALVELTRESLAGTHRVWRADDLTHAADLMVAAGNAAFMIDASLADHDTRDLVNQVHKQFPDLPIIVAGRRDDEATLAPLVSSGVIFRFLHKPASAERIRNFVEATHRRARAAATGDLPAAGPPKLSAPAAITGSYPTIEHPQVTLPKLRVDTALVRRWTRRSLLLVPLALIAWGIAEWRPWDRVDAVVATQEAAPADAGTDPRVLKLLDLAGLALSQGRLVEPPEQNALELYRAVLARDPGNRMAQRGIDSVADELLVDAERALLENDLGRLASAIDAARSARPDHPRLEFFTAQLDRERERAGTSGRQQAADATIGRELDAAAAESTAGRVQSLVQLASDRMRSNRLVGGRDSAHTHLLAARKLDPADAGVQQGIIALSALLQRNAQQAIRENRLDDANNWLMQAVALDIDHQEIARLRSDIEAARIGNVRADRARLLVLANQRIAQGRLIEPSGDSARHYLDLLRAADPAFEGLADTNALFATRALTDARQQAANDNVDRAETLLRAAGDMGAPDSEVTAITATITDKRKAKAIAARAAQVLPENQLTRTRTIAPSYPQRALERGIQGWVDLEYTVRTDGTTTDIVVRGADPEGVFDRAAMQAVERWRYEPRVISGAVVDQRVSARVRFQLEE